MLGYDETVMNTGQRMTLWHIWKYQLAVFGGVLSALRKRTPIDICLEILI